MRKNEYMNTHAFAGRAKKALPYIFSGAIATNIGEALRMVTGADASERLHAFFDALPVAFRNILPSLHPKDLLVGAIGALLLFLIVQAKRMNAKKYRQGVEYGSARWGAYYQL